jgi:hypothetical protein
MMVTSNQEKRTSVNNYGIKPVAALAMFALLLFSACGETDATGETPLQCEGEGRSTSISGVEYCVFHDELNESTGEPCSAGEAGFDFSGRELMATACVKAAQAPGEWPVDELQDVAVELGFFVQGEALVCRDSYDSAEYVLREAASGCTVDDDCAFYVGTDYSDQQQCLYYLGRGYGVLATTDIGALTDSLEEIQANYRAGGCQICAGLGNTGDSEYSVACEAGSCVARFLPDNSDGFR